MAFLLVAPAAHAIPMTFTNLASWQAAVGLAESVADFDAEATGVIASGGSADGITFSYAFAGGEELVVTDAFDTTSAPNFLGTDDFDLLADGNEFSMAFAASNAIGLFILSADVSGGFLVDGDISLTAGGGTATLDVSEIEASLASGADVLFLGIVDPDATFATASLTTPNVGLIPDFFYNVDDVRLALLPVPEPTIAGLICSFALCCWHLRGRRRRV